MPCSTHQYPQGSSLYCSSQLQVQCVDQLRPNRSFYHYCAFSLLYIKAMHTSEHLTQYSSYQNHSNSLLETTFVFKTLLHFCLPSGLCWHRCVTGQQRAAACPALRKAHPPRDLSLQSVCPLEILNISQLALLGRVIQ